MLGTNSQQNRLNQNTSVLFRCLRCVFQQKQINQIDEEELLDGKETPTMLAPI